MDAMIFGQISSHPISNFLRDLLVYVLIRVVIVGTVSAVICTVIMKKKGYDNLVTWFFVGFLLGIVGLIICLVMQNKTNTYVQPPYPNQPYAQPIQPPYSQPAQDSAQSIRCTSCGMMNPPNARFCNECGEKLP